jgi:hypothetical protein
VIEMKHAQAGSSAPPAWLAVSRISPSPVTTGPAWDIWTQRSVTSLANVIAGIFPEAAPGDCAKGYFEQHCQLFRQ